MVEPPLQESSLLWKRSCALAIQVLLSVWTQNGPPLNGFQASKSRKGSLTILETLENSRMEIQWCVGVRSRVPIGPNISASSWQVTVHFIRKKKSTEWLRTGRKYSNLREAGQGQKQRAGYSTTNPICSTFWHASPDRNSLTWMCLSERKNDNPAWC